MLTGSVELNENCGPFRHQPLNFLLHTFFLPLLGISLTHGQRIVGWTLRARSALAWYWLLLLAAALSFGVFQLYKRSSRHVLQWPRLVLASLRTAFLLLLLLLLAHPVLRVSVKGTSHSALLVLIDDSSSMALADHRTDTSDLKRAAIIAGELSPGRGISQPADARSLAASANWSRAQLIQHLPSNRQLSLLRRLGEDYDLVPYTFGKTFAAADANVAVALGATASRQESTAIGDAIAQALGSTRGQPVAGIWLLSDGQNNAGLSLHAAAQMARQAGVPIFSYGIGVTTPRDVVLENIFAPQICFVGDPIPVSLQVRSAGFAGSSVPVRLQLDGVQVAAQDMTVDASGQQIQSLNFTPTHTGDFELAAVADPLPDEASTQNNHAAQHIRVIDARIKVLYIERQPRWEYKYLVALLQRDPRVDLKCWLIDSDPGAARAPHSPFVTAFPATQAELFSYDLLILGDIAPQTLTPPQWQSIDQWVSHFGGGLLTVAGRQFLPEAYRQSPLADMLPIELGTKIAETQAPVFDRPIQVELTEAGRLSPLLKLAGAAAENDRIWRSMPPIYWEAAVAGAKESAQVLLVDPDPAKQRHEQKLPLIAIEPYGIGQVLYVGTDNTWRWRKNIGDQYYAALWGQLVQRLTLPRLLGQSKRTQLRTDRLDYAAGQEITLFARIYDADFQPSRASAIKAVASSPGQASVVATLTPMEAGGTFRGAMIAGPAGAWTLSVESDPATTATFTVNAPALESSETAMNEQGLRDLSDTSGGQFFREENLNDLPDAISSRAQQIDSAVESEICFTGAYFTLLLTLLAIEWVLRKKQHLK